MKFIILSLFLCYTSNAEVWIGDISSFSKWITASSYGNNNREIVLDPKGSGQLVLKLKYPKDSYAGLADKGSGIWVYPFGKTTQLTIATLEYEILFPSEFQWVKGGKLPGLFGGRTGCTGRDEALDCYSARFMWGDNAKGYPYLYLPKYAPHQSDFCALTEYKNCTRDYAFSFNKTTYFDKDRWIKVKEHIEMNTVGQADGILQVWIDGVMKAEYKKMIWRTMSSVNTNGFQIESFFGGSTADWATPIETYTLYRGFKYYDY